MSNEHLGFASPADIADEARSLPRPLDLDLRLDNIEETQAQHSKRLEEHDRMLADHDKAISSINSTLQTVNGTLGGMQASQRSIADQVSALRSDHAGALSTMQGDIKVVKSKMGGIMIAALSVGAVSLVGVLVQVAALLFR